MNSKSGSEPRGIVVIDVGSTNVKAILFDASLREIASKSISAELIDDAPYLHIELEGVIDFACQAILEFDQQIPVDIIVPCSHGSSLALLDNAGQLVFPIMSYNAQPPRNIIEDYAELAPEYSETYSPINPGALTLGRQLLWQEQCSPEQFSKVRQIMPLAQYVGYRLGAGLFSEVSALGAQTHLWNPVSNTFTNLAVERGWADLIAPVKPAWTKTGIFNSTLQNGAGTILNGVHDSNANYFRYQDEGDFALLSTGTWIIAFDGSVELARLDPERDQVSNTSVTGAPIACCRFMGGQEFSLVAGDADEPTEPLKVLQHLFRSECYCLPSFTDSGGPLPESGGAGKIVGEPVDHPINRHVLASVYTAQMTAIALQYLGVKGRIIVDGPFTQNQVYLRMLASIMPNHEILSAGNGGTAIGAAMLAFKANGLKPESNVQLEAIDPISFDGVEQYHENWLKQIG